ncbi:hypothetical protein [Paenirhodobacter sp.]|uniref:hypothetical protein n=1 Tax=Paenirhodobacter sp. TaxID=1965326 RepID=UPI003B3DEAB7
MDTLIWAGALVSVLGIAGILASVLTIARARRAGLADDALRAKLRSAVALNMGALFVSVIGLMMVVLGVTLG